MAEALIQRLTDVPRFATFGRVKRVVGLVIEASGLDVGLGELWQLVPEIEWAVQDEYGVGQVVRTHVQMHGAELRGWADEAP